MSSSTIDYPAFERPDLTFNIVPQNLEPSNIEVGLYQDILKGDLLNTYNDNMDLSISRKIVSLLPKEHDLYIEKGFIEKTDKDPYQIYSDTDSVVGETQVLVNDKQISIEDLYLNFGKKIGSNKEVKDVSSLQLFTPSVDKNFNIENKKIKYVIRHKVINKNKRMFKVKLFLSEHSNDYKEVIITEDHSIMCKRNNKLIEIKIGDIQENDKLLYRINHSTM